MGLPQDQARLTNAIIMAQSSRPMEWFTLIRVYSLPYRNSIANAHSVQPIMRMSEPLRTSPPAGGDETFSMLFSAQVHFAAGHQGVYTDVM